MLVCSFPPPLWPGMRIETGRTMASRSVWRFGGMEIFSEVFIGFLTQTELAEKTRPYWRWAVELGLANPH